MCPWLTVAGHWHSLVVGSCVHATQSSRVSGIIYESFIHQKLVAHKKHLNLINVHYTVHTYSSTCVVLLQRTAHNIRYHFRYNCVSRRNEELYS